MKKIPNNISRLLTAAFAVMLLIASAGMGLESAQSFAQTSKKRPPLRRRAPAAAPAPRTPSVPRGTQMKVRLDDSIDSQKARDGDRFRATVITPAKYADSTVDGTISSVKQSGKIKGQTSLIMTFERINFVGGGSQIINGQVVKIYGEKSVKEVDEEGNVKSDSRGASTAKRTGGGAAAGAIIGAIAGGGKGAAIGAAIGAGVGAGSNVIRGSNKVKLDEGTEMLIRTSR